ncbi:hypothetical protein RMATCC62417_03023 [Rhizopus microsporus]|nr:hypothetical protein RMATCC62417_03023 [Rhizopus microsporus]
MSSLPVKMNAPIFKSSTIVELQEKLKINKVFHKSLSEDTVKDVQALIQYWNMKHALNVSSTSFDNSKNSRFFKTGNKIEPQEFSDVISNSIQPNKEQLAACTGIYELPSTCPETSSVKSSSDIHSHESSKHPSSTFIECSDIEPACSDNAEPTHSSSEEHSPSTESETTADPSPKRKALKAKVQTFFSKIKNAFAKRSSKASQRSFSCVDPISGPIDLSDSEYLEFVFNDIKQPLTPHIKAMVQRRKFNTFQELRCFVREWKEEKQNVQEAFDRVGLRHSWEPKITDDGSYYAPSEFGWSVFWPNGGPYPLPSPCRLSLEGSSLYESRGAIDDGPGDDNASFFDEFEARQLAGDFSYMDYYVDPAMADDGSESGSSCGSLYGGPEHLDNETVKGYSPEKRSSVDQLMQDIWKRSEEYQEYFSSKDTEDEDLDDGFVAGDGFGVGGDFGAGEGNDDGDDYGNEYYGMHLRLVSDKRNVSSSIWNPPTFHAAIGNNIRVPHSQTEVDIRLQDAVPYVKIDGSHSQEHKIPRKKVKQLMVDIDDGALYKRSVSAYSSFKDYDLVWQKTFHEEQQDVDKSQVTLQSVALALYELIQKNHYEGNFECDPLFISPEISYEDDMWETEPLTEWTDLFMEMANIFERASLSSEHAIISYIYLKRMLLISGQCLFDGNWQRLLMLSILTAAKVWEDCSIYNSDYPQMFPDVPTKTINQMEVHYLEYLDWNVNVKCSEFAAAYFYLRQFQDA